MDSKFKTPRMMKRRIPARTLTNPSKSNTDSDESLSSAVSSDQESSNLSLLAEFDEHSRFLHTLKAEYLYVENSYASFVDNTKLLFENYVKASDELMKLHLKLEEFARDKQDLETKLSQARKLFDLQKKHAVSVEKERDDLMMELLNVHKQSGKLLSNDTLARLAMIDSSRLDQEEAPQLTCIPEVNSTGSILSEFSFSRSEDDLDCSYPVARTKKGRYSSAFVDQPLPKKRRPSGEKAIEVTSGGADTIRATTTVTMPKNGPITATSHIITMPSKSCTPSAPPAEQVNQVDYTSPSPFGKLGPPKPSRSKLESTSSKGTINYANNNNNTPMFNKNEHVFQKKTIVLPDICGICEKKLRFGKLAWKCKNCKSICHEECKDNLPVPCTPLIHTPGNRNNMCSLADFVNANTPMIPALLIHCITEIENKGFNEIGLYRIPGSDKEVKTLKDRFLRGKAPPYLKEVDVHDLCCVVKSFLRSLQEPLVPKISWHAFVNACNAKTDQAMRKVISELPQENRDTLSYLILHLQRIAEKKEIKMNVDNLSTIFGPTIVGFFTDDVDDYKNKHRLMEELQKQQEVMKCLLRMPSSFYESFLNVTQIGASLGQTPSTDSLFKMTPLRGNHCQSFKKKFFDTPPH